MIREEIHTFFNEKEKYFLSIILEKDIKNIIINVRNNNESNITHQTKYNFDNIKENDIEFFYAFNNDIILLFKFLCRILKANYYKLKKNKNGEIILTLYCFLNKAMKFINILIPKNDKIITDEDFFIKEEEEINNKPCAPVPKNNVFFYSAKTLYKIKITKKKSEIVFHIFEDDIFNQLKGIKNKEFLVKKNYDDFIKLSHGYYSLFNGSLDDIYEDLLINFYNENYKLKIYNSKIILSLYVFNFHKFNYTDIYLCINFNVDLISHRRSKTQLKRIISLENNKCEIKNKKIEKNNPNEENEMIIEEEGVDNLIKEKIEQKYEDSNINNFDEETDFCNSKNNNSNIKENIDDLEVKCVEIKKEDILIPATPTNIPNKPVNSLYKIQEESNNNFILKKIDKFKVTKVEEKNENKEEILEPKKLDNVPEKKNLSGLFIVDKGENKKEIKINNQQNINYINSIIINYVQLNNPKSKRNGIYNFVINKFENDKEKQSEINENKNGQKIIDNINFHDINFGKSKEELKTKRYIKNDNIKFLTQKRKNINSINELFITTKENTEEKK